MHSFPYWDKVVVIILGTSQNMSFTKQKVTDMHNFQKIALKLLTQLSPFSKRATQFSLITWNHRSPTFRLC